MSEPTRITSRDNALLAELRRLARDGAAYRRHGVVWIEGDHLCRAASGHGVVVQHAVLSESGWAVAALRELARGASRRVVVSDALWRSVSALPSPAAIGFVAAAPEVPALDAHAPSVVLDRIQDAGNVGSILRSAAAFGVHQVIAMTGTAALWSPKVLRAGMGAHFALRLVEGAREADLAALRVPLLAASSHASTMASAVTLPSPAAWVFGNEGQGIAPGLLGRCAMTLAIPQPGGQESLNVAAAAAVCLFLQAMASPRAGTLRVGG